MSTSVDHLCSPPEPAEPDVGRAAEFWGRQCGFRLSSSLPLLAAWLWADYSLNLSLFICKVG